MDNFLITGHPRSGTKYLATLLNRSSWEVHHEVDYEKDEFEQTEEHFKEVLERFNRDKYGEVTSCLKWCASHLPVSKKAIIVRDLESVWLSIVNSHVGQLKKMESLGIVLKPAYTQNVKHEVIDHWGRFKDETQLLFRLLESGIPALQFKRLISDVDYVNNLVNWLGIEGFRVTFDMMISENETAPIQQVYISYEDLPVYYKHIDELEYFDRWIEKS